MYHFLEPPNVSARDFKSSIYMTQLCPMTLKKCFVLKNVGTTKQAMFLCLDLSDQVHHVICEPSLENSKGLIPHLPGEGC